MKIISPAFLLASALALYILQNAPTPEIQLLNLTNGSSALKVLNDKSVLVVNMIPEDQSGESSQDSEPFLAVSIDPQKPEQSLLVGAAYKGKFQEAGATPLMLSSTDGGWTWKQRSILSTKQVGSHTYCFSGKKNSFYGAVQITEGANQTISVFHADDPSTDKALDPISNISSGAEFSDAPFIQAHAFGEAPKSPNDEDKRVDNVYVGHNYFGFSGQQKTRTASIQVANDGKSFKLKQLEARDTGSAKQDGPVVRPAVANDGTVYVAFLHWSSKEEGGRFRGDVIVSRDDDAGRSDTAFRDLVDPSDGLPGRMVVRDRLFSAYDKLDQQRVIAPLSLAVHPTNSANVYVAWGDYDVKTNSHVLHVRRSNDKGQNWSPEDIQTIPSATNPSLAVSADGVVGFLYQQLAYSEPGRERRWETKFISSLDGATTGPPVPLAVFPTEGEPQSGTEFGLYLGFRSHLLAVGSSFYGIFSAPNKPEQKYFPQGVKFQRNVRNNKLYGKGEQEVDPSIDPYFFRVTPLVETSAGTKSGPAVGDKDSSRGWMFLTLSKLTPILVGLAVVLTALAVVQLQRAQQASVITSEQLRKTTDEIQGPPLINYTGYVSIRFTDLNGSAIEQPGTSSRLIVTFADTAQGNKFEEAIVIQGGKDAPEVVFTVVVDSINLEIEPEHRMVSVPMKGSREAVFELRPLDSTEQSLYVQVFERTRLVQVVAHTANREAGLAT